MKEGLWVLLTLQIAMVMILGGGPLEDSMSPDEISVLTERAWDLSYPFQHAMTPPMVSPMKQEQAFFITDLPWSLIS